MRFNTIRVKMYVIFKVGELFLYYYLITSYLQINPRKPPKISNTLNILQNCSEPSKLQRKYIEFDSLSRL